MAEPGAMTAEAKKFILGLAFLGQEAPKELWVGLSRRRTLSGDEPTLADFARSEPPARLGYARQRLEPSDWRITRVSERSFEATSRETAFINPSDEPWPSVDLSFVATTQDGTGVLLGWSYLQTTRDVFRGDEVRLIERVRL